MSAGRVDGAAAAGSWPNTVAALSAFRDVMRSLCAHLQLGNVAFETTIVDGEERSTIASVEELEKLWPTWRRRRRGGP